MYAMIKMETQKSAWEQSRLAIILMIDVYPSLDGVLHLIGVRVQKNNITFRKDAQQKKNVTEKSKQTCPYAITFGMKIGNVQNVAREIVVITT